MLPHLDYAPAIDQTTRNFADALSNTAYTGDISTDIAQRISLQNDNSLYQKMPQLILHPRVDTDIKIIVSLANTPPFKALKLTARGGGTSTCGQSLTDGIVIDCSKWMTNILEINPEKNYVRVQPGVILDQLNRALEKHGLFFSIEISTGSRATLGGMFNTNACGQGACLYGRFADHVIESRGVLSDGKVHNAREINPETLNKLQSRTDQVGRIYTEMSNVLISEPCDTKRFSDLSRGITGYDLAKAYNPKTQRLNPNRLLCGSEGTLAIISELKLAIQPRPRHKALFALLYQDFQQALRHAKTLATFSAAAIETVDHTILTLAKQDEIYPKVAPLFKHNLAKGQALTLVEFVDNDPAALQQKITTVSDLLKTEPAEATGLTEFIHTKDPDSMHSLWTLRKKGVGLLGNLKGNKRPAPFIEDTAVPVEHLSDYMAELTTLLDKMKLSYGIFGHVDAGCLHVRPALDMTKPAERDKVKIITEKVIILLKKYHGILWAEHGKGYRSQFNEAMLGEKLYHACRRIKTVFDANDRFNPGKVATSLNHTRKLIDIETDFRGKHDQTISPHLRTQSGNIMHCNGNGACFTKDKQSTLCPSYQSSLDRVQSPKGRASLIRQWLQQISHRPFSLSTNTKRTFSFGALIQRHLLSFSKTKAERDFSTAVFKALDTCLGCKACASDCPIHVDIPKTKALFLAHYYTRYRRPLRDFMIAHSESIAYWQSKFSPALSNVYKSSWLKALFFKIGMVDLPAPNLQRPLRALKIFKLEAYQRLSKKEQAKTVIIVQDALTRFYDSPLLLKAYTLLQHLGFNVSLLPLIKNGKPFHVKGFITTFKHIVMKNNETLRVIGDLKIPLVGIEPSLTLTFRDEYKTILGSSQTFKIWQFQEWLATKLKQDNAQASPFKAASKDQAHYHLLSHCTEKALNLFAERDWQAIFEHFGLTLSPAKVGCCGMAGAYGHERANLKASKHIYGLSWAPKINAPDIPTQQLLATGFSCREQVKRLSHIHLKHPIDVLLEMVRASKH